MYYGIYKWYADYGDSGSEAGGFCAIAGFQTFNILSVIWFYDLIIQEREISGSQLFGILLFVTLVILNYIRYIWIERFSKEVIQAKWESKPLESQKKIRMYLGMYVLISLALFIGLIAYSASKKM